ncbi:MAG: hypothetical protein H0T56_11020 [Pseudaminobacter sp.]|nr:hypothetical protein [Pseudaminobacter sp.]
MSENAQTEKLLAIIRVESDPKKLKTWMENARTQKSTTIYEAAFRRYCELSGREYDDVLDREFHEVMTALETALSEVRGRTTWLNRTRQKLNRVGVKQLLADLAMSPTPSDGFRYLLDFGMADMSAEALVIKHQQMFSNEVVNAARARLLAFNINIQE